MYKYFSQILIDKRIQNHTEYIKNMQEKRISEPKISNDGAQNSFYYYTITVCTCTYDFDTRFRPESTIFPFLYWDPGHNHLGKVNPLR